MSLRKRIENSETVAALLAALARGYLGLCNRTIRWDIEGYDEICAAIDAGPVLVIMWHERSLMGALHWPFAHGSLSSLYANSPVGRVSGALQRSMGLKPIEMSDKQSNRAASRTVLRRVKEGVSIGMTADGPLGPARQLKDAAIDWARVTGMPIFCYAYGTDRAKRLKSWDKMLFPRPFGRGRIIYARFDSKVARRASSEAQAQLRQELAAFLTATTDRADVPNG